MTKGRNEGRLAGCLLEVECRGVRIRIGEIAGKVLISLLRVLGLALSIVLATMTGLDFSAVIPWIGRVGL